MKTKIRSYVLRFNPLPCRKGFTELRTNVVNVLSPFPCTYLRFVLENVRASYRAEKNTKGPQIEFIDRTY